MEKIKKVLVLGDSKVGKTTFLQQLFDEYKAKQYMPGTLLKDPHPTVGCMLHTHYLNPYYKEIRNSDVDYFVEFHDISGTLTQQSDILKVYLGEKFDGIIIAFDLNNLKSLRAIRKYLCVLNSINKISKQEINDDDIELFAEQDV